MTFKPHHFSKDVYLQHKSKAETHSEDFWKEQALKLTWDEPFTSVFKGDFEKGDISWFEGGKLNACFNCLDHSIANGFGNKVAYYYQSEDGKVKSAITYLDLLQKVSSYCHIFKNQGVKKGDRVLIYMPMGLEIVATMLASARMGLVHSVVFAGFSAQAIKSRIEDCRPSLIITANSFQRGGKKIPLLTVIREALQGEKALKTLVFAHQLEDLKLKENEMDLGALESSLLKKSPSLELFQPELMAADDPLFILYTSGSTGKPKGLVHTTGGYLTYAAYTFKHVFDYDQAERFWCSADAGWITGHTYGVYGPLLNSATSLLFEGAPSVPHWGRSWELIDEYKINIYYTAPTAIRSFMAQGEGPLKSAKLTSLRLLGTVGEPINPAAWHWYDQMIGKGKCPIVDTWWQTETGGIMATPIAGVHNAIPGWAMESLPGIFPELLDVQTGLKLSEREASGALVITRPWPGMARTIYGDKERFFDTYFKPYPGYYFTGDGCERNKDGHLRITGRIDDVINVAGHRLGTAEIESALVKHNRVAEAAVVGREDEIKGQAICCFVRKREGSVDGELDDHLRVELEEMVMKEIGRFARPQEIIFVPDLPKTRSGKIMRRILRKLAAGETEGLGDLSTLAIPEVINQIKLMKKT